MRLAPLVPCIAAAAWLALAMNPPPAAGDEGEKKPAENQPDESVSQDRIEQLIARLGHEDYFVRERAQEELAAIGFEAFDALSAAEEHEDIEVATRARYLIRLMRIDWIAEGDPPEIKELLANYDAAAEKDKMAIISQLAALPRGLGVPVLCRMVRFEKSPILSKYAALAVLGRPPSNADERKGYEEMIRSGVGRSTRPGAKWLDLYLAGGDKPDDVADAWAEQAQAEEDLLTRAPQDTRPEIVIALWRQQVALLRELGRQDEAVAAMMKIVARDPGSTETLTELLDWLVEQRAWDVVDEVATRFADRFEGNPLLLYALAEARQAQGDDALAREAAEKALKLNDGNPEKHWGVANALHRRGLRKYAEAEYRRVIEIGGDNKLYARAAQIRLSEILHDAGDDLDAAKLLEEAVASFQSELKQGGQDLEEAADLGPIRARLHYFHACRAEAESDRPSQIDHLKQALEYDPQDADVLIALYRAPDLDAALAQRTRQLIREAADEFRRQIQQNPEDPTPYNQLAWLVSNTEGDQQEALRSSQKSLELVRRNDELRLNEAGYLDTLGRCYYAQGDYENAVKHQSQAVSIDPHSGLMQKQLELFQKTLAESKQARP